MSKTPATGPFNSPVSRQTGTQTTQIIDEFLYQGSPAQTFRWNMDAIITGNTALSATGVAQAVSIALQAGDVISNITVGIATTAANTPTHQYFALYDNSATPALLSTSGDLTTTARAANTNYTIPLLTQVTIQQTGVYWVSISFTATTVPTVWGRPLANAAQLGAFAGSSIRAQSHGTALAGIAPATIAAPTTVANMAMVILT